MGFVTRFEEERIVPPSEGERSGRDGKRQALRGDEAVESMPVVYSTFVLLSREAIPLDQ